MLNELAAAMLAYTERQAGDSPYTTAIETMTILRTDRPKPPAHRLAQPAMCIVAQGAKWANFGDMTFQSHSSISRRAGASTVCILIAPTKTAARNRSSAT